MQFLDKVIVCFTAAVVQTMLCLEVLQLELIFKVIDLPVVALRLSEYAADPCDSVHLAVDVLLCSCRGRRCVVASDKFQLLVLTAGMRGRLF